MSTEIAKQAKDTKKELPTGWRWVKLGDLCQFVRGVSFDKADVLTFPEEGRLPILRSGNINLRLDTENDIIWIPNRYVSAEQLLRPGDIVICMSSGSADVVGKTARVEAAWRGSIGAFCGIVRADNSATAAFIDLWFHSRFFLDWRDAQARGVNIQNLRFSQLEKLDIPIPHLDEQRRLAGVLREQMAQVDRGRAAAEVRLEAIKALQMAYYREAFGESAVFVASPLTPREPTRPGWHWHRLTDIARLATGHTPSRYHPEYWQGDIPWIQLADIRALDGRETFDTSEHTNMLGIENSAAVLLPQGTVCMSRTASVGFFTIMGRQMSTSQDFVNWVCGPDLDPWFLMHLLVASRKSIRKLGSGAVHHTIYFPTVQAFSICMPPVSEQKRIAAFLIKQMAALDKARVSAEEELQMINALPAALLRQAFNGELQGVAA